MARPSGSKAAGRTRATAHGLRAPVLVDRLFVHPVRLVALAFLAIALAGTLLLMLPMASASDRVTPAIDALFTAVSALCVTGLATLDTGTHWSGFGQIVILVLIQLGGLGLMLVSALLAGLVWKRLSLAQHRALGAENSGLASPAMVKPALRLVVGAALLVEALLALWLTLRLMWGHDMSLGEASWFGLFHAISAYNNAGFGLRADSMMGFAGDPLILGGIAAAILIGGLGLPVLWDLRANRARSTAPGGRLRWSLHTRITVAGSLVLLAIGWAATLAFEWSGALGGMAIGDKIVNGAFYSVSLRTAGFNNFAMDHLSDATMTVSSVLMFIGAGSASTGGGIKVGTAVVLALVVLSELRGRRDVGAFGRRIGGAVQRRATAIIVLALALIVAAALAISAIAAAQGVAIGMRDILFECVSAFATVGLSTGITASLPDAAKLIIIALMFIGRVGPVTVGAALILRSRPDYGRYPKEEPVIG